MKMGTLEPDASPKRIEKEVQRTEETKEKVGKGNKRRIQGWPKINVKNVFNSKKYSIKKTNASDCTECECFG